MADEEFGRRVPFAFLEDIKNRFKSLYGNKGKTAMAYAMNEEFSKVLKKQMVSVILSLVAIRHSVILISLCFLPLLLFHFLLGLQDFYSNNPNADKLTEVRGEIQAVKEVMVQNIGTLLSFFSLLLLFSHVSFLDV